MVAKSMTKMETVHFMKTLDGADYSTKIKYVPLILPENQPEISRTDFNEEIRFEELVVEDEGQLQYLPEHIKPEDCLLPANLTEEIMSVTHDALGPEGNTYFTLAGFNQIDEAFEEVFPPLKIEVVEENDGYSLAEPENATASNTDDAKSHNCELCSYSSPRRSNLLRHMIKHKPEHPYKCLQCSYSAKDSILLTKHMQIHIGDHGHKCEQCDYRTSQRRNLTRHMLSHAEKSHKCTECSFKSSNPAALESHIRIHTRILTDKTPHECNVCGYRTFKRFYLTRHMRTHSGEKPYKCELCQYSAVDRSGLTKHIRTHSGEKPFVCEICNHAVAQRYLLTRHMAKHEKKTYKCTDCAFSARDEDALAKHLPAHYDELCQFCEFQTLKKFCIATHAPRTPVVNDKNANTKEEPVCE